MINFNEITKDTFVPFTYVEFDGAGAVGGSSIQPYKALVIGQRGNNIGKSVAENEIRQISNPQAAESIAGEKSGLHRFAKAFFNNNPNELLYMAMLKTPDSTGRYLQKYTIKTGESTTAANGTTVYNGFITYSIFGVERTITLSERTGVNIAFDLALDINEAGEFPFNAAHSSTKSTFELQSYDYGVYGKHEIGASRFKILEYSLETTDATPVVHIIEVDTEETAGTGEPDDFDADALEDLMGEDIYNLIYFVGYGEDEMNAFKSVLKDRWSAYDGKDGVCMFPLRNLEENANGEADDSIISDITDFAEELNSPYLCGVGIPNSFTVATSSIMGALAGQMLRNAKIDIGLPFQFLGLKDLRSKRGFSYAQRNTLIQSGVSTLRLLNNTGEIQIEAMVTTSLVNSTGQDITTYRYLNVLLLLSYLRYDFKNSFSEKYSRYKLGSDDIKYSAGQKIMTVSVATNECIAIFKRWLRVGLVEKLDDFKSSINIQRNTDNPNRLDVSLSPNLINQLRVVAAQFKFKV